MNISCCFTKKTKTVLLANRFFNFEILDYLKKIEYTITNYDSKLRRDIAFFAFLGINFNDYLIVFAIEKLWLH